MNTAPLKNFAVESRKILKQGVLNRIIALGFDEEGRVTVEEPTKIQGGTIFMGQLMEEELYEAWKELKSKIESEGIKAVCEEAAYTWFNRLVALWIMYKNGFIPAILEYVNEESRVPVIVSQARAGRISIKMKESERRTLDNLLADPSMIDEVFALLLKAYCEDNAVIYKCFGGIAKHIGLLLPSNILAKGGFVDLLNNTTYLTNDDYKQPELIGWLYQFYISEKKDEVFDSFKKGKKAEAEDIPAATQIFTPNWIVKYMVQNTLGRIYLDNNPDSVLEEKMQYLVRSEETTAEESVLKIEEVEEYKVIDPACGSGHILNEAFDMLYEMYMEQLYSPRTAIEKILTKNLIGIDIDTRAKQLAMFSLLMKATMREKSFIDGRVMPRVLDMPEAIETDEALLQQYFAGGSETAIKETKEAFGLLKEAKNLGSIMKFNLSENTRYLIEKRTAEWKEREFAEERIKALMPSMKLILALTDKYSVVVANPPYMGSGNMNAVLSKYVKEEYEEGKADLCTSFMMMQSDKVVENGFYANIIPPSWMFLGTFEGLRRRIIYNESISSLLHLSRGVFGADFGSVSCVIQKTKNENAKGTYFRLIERTFQEFDQKHLQMLFEKTLANHDFKYYFADYTKDVADIVYSERGAKIYYPNVEQKNFEKIPGCPIGYWLSFKWFTLFESPKINDFVTPKAGLVTGNDPYFVREWYEVSYLEINKKTPVNEVYSKYHLFHKGGSPRKYYGDGEYVIKLNDFWNPSFYNVSIRRGDPDYYFKKGIGWSQISSSSLKTFRCIENCTCGTATPTIYPNDYKLYNFLLGLLNSPIAKHLLYLYNPTMNLLSTNICDIPLVECDCFELFDRIVVNNIAISKQDWDAHETSWDFKRNELLRMEGEETAESVEKCYEAYREKWEGLFMQLHENEEELNRQFIEIYGLQDELTPDVPLEEITILQQGEITVKDAEIVFNKDVVMRQLISYVIGCWMGRYRLDREGLNIAYYPKDEEICSYDVKGYRFEIDDDGIIPLMPRENPFEDDNALQKVENFVKMWFGEKRLTENLNYVEHCLGKSIEEYLVKDYWKEHKKMYQNRPIYWLFSSRKGAFQVIVYMHRMNPYTAEKVRTKYLLPYIKYLDTKIQQEKARGANLTTIERRALTKMESALKECTEYEERLHKVADQQIGFDLDDGVTVNYAKFGDVLAKIK